MTGLKEIERAVEQLEGEDFSRFRSWFEELAADRFDRRIEADIESGKLDKLLEEALSEHRAGHTRPL